MENTETSFEMKWKIWKKPKLNNETKLKIRKKSKLNIEMIWKMWKKGKLKSGKIWKIKWWQNFVRNVIIEINIVIIKKNWRGRVETSARASS
jgi:hypothetical protein